jgi:hypothetical protein
MAEDEMKHLSLNSLRPGTRPKTALCIVLYPYTCTARGSRHAGRKQSWATQVVAIRNIRRLSLSCCATIRDESGLELLDELLKTHIYWRRRNIKIDLVILNQSETGYHDDLN